LGHLEADLFADGIRQGPQNPAVFHEDGFDAGKALVTLAFYPHQIGIGCRPACIDFRLTYKGCGLSLLQ
jgi:hypothetical protein